MAETILLVEDEEKLARMVELELRYEGYEVEKAFDGRTGLERALSGEYDLVLLDIMLPGADGLAILRRLRETPLKDFMTYWENLPLFESQKALPKKVRAAVRANRLANDPEALAKCVECAGQHRMPSYRETTAALRDLGLRGYPALYLAGEKDAKYSKLAASLHEEGIVRTRIAPKVGHNVHLEAPEVFAACVHSVATR